MVFVLLLVLRLMLRFVVLDYANKSLLGMQGYYVHIQDIDLALIGGACKIDKGYLDNKVDSRPFMLQLKKVSLLFV